MTLHPTPLSPRERASTLVLAMFIVVAAWIGAFGCIARPFSVPPMEETPYWRLSWKGTSLKEFHESFPQAADLGQRVIKGVRIDGRLVEHSYQPRPEFTRHQWTLWYFFHEGRHVLTSAHESWNLAANEVLAERDTEERMRNAAERARRAAPSDSW